MVAFAHSSTSGFRRRDSRDPSSDATLTRTPAGPHIQRQISYFYDVAGLEGLTAEWMFRAIFIILCMVLAAVFGLRGLTSRHARTTFEWPEKDCP